LKESFCDLGDGNSAQVEHIKSFPDPPELRPALLSYTKLKSDPAKQQTTSLHPSERPQLQIKRLSKNVAERALNSDNGLVGAVHSFSESIDTSEHNGDEGGAI
jgi:hypothetical protein